MLKGGVLFALFVAAVQGLQVHEERRRCPNATWGIWIDGRDAVRGEYYYGHQYNHEMHNAMEKVYMMSDAAGGATAPLKMETLSGIMELVGETWRGYPNPIRSQVQKCHEVLPKRYLDDIWDHIVVGMRDDYVDSAERYNVNFTVVLEDVLKRYNDFMPKVTKREDKIGAVSWLVQNLAFLHPLNDKNGRSRLLLLQHELRRTGVSCGTMMYNNNKNVYFDNLKLYVTKVTEGIDMYNLALQNEFRFNPWADVPSQDHFRKMHSKWKLQALEKCWEETCRNNEQCKGTSPV